MNDFRLKSRYSLHSTVLVTDLFVTVTNILVQLQLSLHPTTAGRVYAAYGGVYVSTVMLWLWGVDGIRPHLWDFVGVAVTLVGMGIIMFAPR